MKREIVKRRADILERTSFLSITDYCDGFISAGILSVPGNHYPHKKVNPIILYLCTHGNNKKTHKNVVTVKLALKLNEAEDIVERLQDTIRHLKEEL